jgi:hypothetical protein
MQPSLGQGRCPEHAVKAFIVIVAWCLLLVLCWPVAILAIVLWPLVWLIALPFRLLAIVCSAVFALIGAILFLPARLLGYRDRSNGRVS